MPGHPARRGRQLDGLRTVHHGGWDFFGGCSGNTTAGVLCCSNSSLCVDVHDPTHGASGFYAATSQQYSYVDGNPSYDNMQWILYDWPSQTFL